MRQHYNCLPTNRDYLALTPRELRKEYTRITEYRKILEEARSGVQTLPDGTPASLYGDGSEAMDLLESRILSGEQMSLEDMIQALSEEQVDEEEEESDMKSLLGLPDDFVEVDPFSL